MRFGAALDLWHKGETPLFSDVEAVDSPLIPSTKAVVTTLPHTAGPALHVRSARTYPFPSKPKPATIIPIASLSRLSASIEDPTKDALRDQAANEYAAELCQQIDLCTTMEKLVEWRKANSDKVNGLAPVHKAKVTAYWMEIEKIIKES
jgi:hypothetical protein